MVEADDNDVKPDAVPHRGEPLPGDAITVPDPLMVVEVLSPGTRGDELTRKLVTYFRLQFVWRYLVFWADQQQAIPTALSSDRSHRPFHVMAWA